MYYVYAIKSRTGGSYVGSSRNAGQRINAHNHGACTTTRGHKWEAVFVLTFEEKTDALMVEAWLKVGDTPQKRATILRAFNLMGDKWATDQALRAARRWRGDVIKRNMEYGR